MGFTRGHTEGCSCTAVDSRIGAGDNQGHGEALYDSFLLPTLALCSRPGRVHLPHRPGARAASHRDPLDLVHMVRLPGPGKCQTLLVFAVQSGVKRCPVGSLLMDSKLPMSPACSPCP